MTLALAILGGYLIGSIPVAYLVARAWGVDIFSVGTGNPGAANTFRTVGRGAGLLVLLADVARGSAAVLLAAALGIEAPVLRVVAGAAAVVGHWYPVFLAFRGGAGLAPSIGVALAAVPVPTLIGLVPGLATLVLLRNTSVAAGVGYAALLIVALLTGQAGPALAVIAVAALVLLHTLLVYERFTAKRRLTHSR